MYKCGLLFIYIYSNEDVSDCKGWSSASLLSFIDNPLIKEKKSSVLNMNPHQKNKNIKKQMTLSVLQFLTGVELK